MHTHLDIGPFLGCLLCALVLLASSSASAETYPPPPAPTDSSRWGEHIQRTMALLATSTPPRRNKVRVLFYGQSITEQEWTKLVADDLRRRFPEADLDIQNRALGGFSSQVLVKTAEQDLYPFYPDLLIFHVYGDHRRYEDSLARTRQRTAAEVVLMTDHWGADTDKSGQLVDSKWGEFMDECLHKVAAKYGCEVVEVKQPWAEYLTANHLKAQALLKDGIHLNDHGNYLMAELAKRQLLYRPEVQTEQSRGLVREYEVGKHAQWEGDTLTLEFDGNRVDVLSARAAGAPAVSAEVLIDGRRPSSFPALYAFTKPTGMVQPKRWPSVMQAMSKKPRLVEDWSCELTAINADNSVFRFKGAGSVTGLDGEGVNTEKFVSNSGWVVIEPDDWCVQRSFELMHEPVTPGMRTEWKCVPEFVDTYAPPEAADPVREYPSALALGLPNGKHTLELRGRVPVKLIRIYRPPIRADERPLYETDGPKG